MEIQNLNLSDLKFFLDTVKTGSFTQAAQLNFVSRPAISQGISRLEKWHNTPLLIHKKRELKLSPGGEEFFRRAKEAYENFQRQLATGTSRQNHLSIGCSASLAESILTPLLKTLGNKIELNIKSGTTTQLIQHLDNEAINIAIYIESGVHCKHETRKIRNGSFGLFSKSGKKEELTIVTEYRPEVIEFKNWYYRNKFSTSLLTVESWSLARTLSEQLKSNCLLPDVVANSKLKKITTPGFHPKYDIILAHRHAEFLSHAEINFCKMAGGIKT